jgi:transposase
LWNQHPKPIGSRRATPLRLFQHPPGHRQITSWKVQLESGAADVFGPGGGTAAQSAVDVKSLHAKIGELTLENDS